MDKESLIEKIFHSDTNNCDDSSRYWCDSYNAIRNVFTEEYCQLMTLQELNDLIILADNLISALSY